MATVKDYKSGKVLTDTKVAFLLLKFVKVPVIGFVIAKILLKGTGKFQPKIQINAQWGRGCAEFYIKIQNLQNQYFLMNWLKKTIKKVKEGTVEIGRGTKQIQFTIT